MDLSQAVARLQRVQSKSQNALVTNANYIPGHFYRFVSNSGISTRTMKVAALVFRGDQVAVAKENMPLALNDRVCTGPDTLGLIEFLIGGRVTVNASTEVVINSERSVVDVNTPVGRTIINTLAVLVGWDNRTLRRPLEIQTNGGTMGIKG